MSSPPGTPSVARIYMGVTAAIAEGLDYLLKGKPSPTQKGAFAGLMRLLAQSHIPLEYEGFPPLLGIENPRRDIIAGRYAEDLLLDSYREVTGADISTREEQDKTIRQLAAYAAALETLTAIPKTRRKNYEVLRDLCKTMQRKGDSDSYATFCGGKPRYGSSHGW